jgi:hypothetical protein
MKTMPRKGFMALLAAPQKGSISSSTGDDELDDLEIQRRTIPPRYSRRSVTTLKFGSGGQTVIYPNEDALRYSDMDWNKGRVSGRVEMTDPDNDSNLGSGSFVFISKLYKEGVKIFCYDEKSKKYVATGIGKPSTTKPSGKPQITDLIRVEIVDPKEEIERGKGERCAIRSYKKRIVKICVWILGKRYCAEVNSK